MDQTRLNSTAQSHVDSIEVAGKMLEKQMATDNSFVPLLERTLIIPPNIVASSSGQKESDYPDLSTVSSGLASAKLMTLVNKVPLPPEVLERFRHFQCNCMMGLFPEISRAWLTIDSDIYVWTYEHGSDVAYFDGLSETIVSVGLFKPKSGVFNVFVKYLLVLTTAVEIVILGVTFSRKDDGLHHEFQEMNLLPDPVFVIPTDGVAVNTVAATDSGRIFLGGSDGCLYEIIYQAKSNWFGKRYKKVNLSTSALSYLVPSFLNFAFRDDDPIKQISVDNSRHILFLLTEKGTILVYDLGEDGWSAGQVGYILEDAVAKSAYSITNQTLDTNIFRPLVSICAIERTECVHYNLIAVAESGVRFYFSTGSVMNPSSRPHHVQLLHVRLPPGYSANTLGRPSKVHMAHYRKGDLLLITSPGGDSDVLWCLSSDLYPFRSYIAESQTILYLDGTVWAMKEVAGMDMRSKLQCMGLSKCYTCPPALPPTPLPSPVPGPGPTSSAQQSLYPQLHDQAQQQQLQLQQRRQLSTLFTDPPPVVSQHIDDPSKFVVLTSQGAEIYVKLRPVDLLQQLLARSTGAESECVKAFFHVLNEVQACATALVLATVEGSVDTRVSEMATRAFFMYGGEPCTGSTQPQLMSSPFRRDFHPNRVSTPLQPTMSQLSQTTQLASTVNQMLSPGIMHYSAKHDGLYLYVGRILRPIWNLRVTYTKKLETKVNVLCSTVPAEDCTVILQHLHGLKTFLERNSQYSPSGLTNLQLQASCRSLREQVDQTPRSQQSQVQEAFLEEKRSLDALKVFVSHTCEVLGLWRILSEHQFHLVATMLSEEQQSQLKEMPFRSLILMGHELCSVLINCLIIRYLNDNASVDSVSAKLREICPNLYRAEDAACSKANEMLLTAKNLADKEEREAKLRTALELCKEVAPNVKLSMICQWFTAAQFYQGVLEMTLTCAAKVDPKNIALHYYKNNEPPEDFEGLQAFAKRVECYKELTVVLDQLYNQSQAGVLSSSVPRGPGAPVINDVSQSLTDEADLQARWLVEQVLQSQDELFHVAVYEWMMCKRLYSMLGVVTLPSMGLFLSRASKNNPTDIHVFDLMVQYYRNTKNFVEAARILHRLATQPGNLLNLDQRSSYLGRAVAFLQSDKVGCAPHLGSFMRDLEDLLETSRVQKQVLLDVMNLRGHHHLAEESIEKLNSCLMGVTQLWDEFAEPFDLWESKLAIIYCAGYTDSILVESIWQHIIDEELQRCGHASPDDKMTSILTKVKCLGKDYANAPVCFPVEFLVKQLEISCCRLNASPSHVHTALRNIGVPWLKLLEIYEALFVRKERCWLAEGDEFYVVRVIASLVDSFISSAKIVSATERRVAVEKALDVISSCLTLLYSKPDTTQLVEQLRGIQARLQRMR